MTENETETSDAILNETIGMGNTQEDTDSDLWKMRPLLLKQPNGPKANVYAIK